jgi:hypothetical protein
MVGDPGRSVDTAFAEFWDQLPWRPDATNTTPAAARISATPARP